MSHKSLSSYKTIRKLTEKSVGILQTRLGNRDQDVYVCWSSEIKSYMTCFQEFGSNNVWIKISKETNTTACPRYFVKSLIHELLHAHIFQLTHFVTKTVRRITDDQAVNDAFDSGLLQFEEMMVDRMASALVDSMASDIVEDYRKLFSRYNTAR
jgi:hypothetical protein